MQPVYISLTTIPSRLNRIVQDNLLHLLKQDFPVEQIFLTVPLENMRGQPAPEKLPEFLSQSPLAERVTVLRPRRDLGPIMKYLGFLEANTPEDCWVFVCDDDQKYATALVKNMVARATLENPRQVYTHGWSEWLIRGVHGYSGVLIHKQALEALQQDVERNGVPDCCAKIDDDYVSILLHRNKFQVIENRRPKYQVLETANAIRESEDALHTSHRRWVAQGQCYLSQDTFHFQVIALSVCLGILAIGVGLFSAVQYMRPVLTPGVSRPVTTS